MVGNGIARALDKKPMTEIPRDHLGSDEVRRIASEYLHALARYYAELQKDAGSLTVDPLQERAEELLSAMAITDKQQRRNAVLRVLCSLRDLISESPVNHRNN